MFYSFICNELPKFASFSTLSVGFRFRETKQQTHRLRQKSMPEKGITVRLEQARTYILKADVTRKHLSRTMI